MHHKLLLALFGLAIIATAAPAAASDDTEDDYYDEEDFGEEFCGGEETPYDEAYMLFDEEDFADARDVLVNALSSHDYYRDSRPAYLILLGQTQMRLGDSRHAAVNFSRAIAAAPEYADENGARLGLAVALAERGDRRRALEAATQFIDAQCATETGNATHCYIANVVLAAAGRDAETREKGRAETARLRGELSEYQVDAVRYYEELFQIDASVETADARRGAEDGSDETA